MLVHKQTTQDTIYRYSFSNGLVSYNDINIYFQNGKFHWVKFPFECSYSREDWKVLSAIEREITKIEDLLIAEKDSNGPSSLWGRVSKDSNPNREATPAQTEIPVFGSVNPPSPHSIHPSTTNNEEF